VCGGLNIPVAVGGRANPVGDPHSTSPWE